MLFGIIQSKVVWKQLRNTRGRGVIATCFSNPKRIWYPPLLYWHLSGGSWWHSHTLSLNLLALLVLLPGELCPWWLSFSSPSLESRSLETRVEVSSIRLGEAVKRLTTQQQLFFLFFFYSKGVYIYLYLYHMYSMLVVVVVVVVLPGTTSLRIVSPYILIGCCQQTIVCTVLFLSLTVRIYHMETF